MNDINMSPTTESFEFTDFNPLKSIPLYKVVLLGNVGVGKSTFFRRYRDGYFTHVKNDCGLDKFERVYKRKNKNVKLQLWDTAGLERTGNLMEKYFRSCKAILLMHDLTDRTSYYDAMTKWKEYSDDFCPDDVMYFVIGTKKDEARKKEIILPKPKGLFKQIPEENYFTISIQNDDEFENCMTAITDKLIENGQPAYLRDRFRALTLSDEHKIEKIKTKCCET